MGKQSGSARPRGFRRRVFGAVAATLVVSAMAAASPSPADGRPAQTGIELTVTPDHDLTDGTLVTVTLSETPSAPWGIVQCPATATHYFDCDAVEAGWDRLTLRVDTLPPTGLDPLEVTDCRGAGACVLRLVVAGHGSFAFAGEAPLHFDPDAPPAPPPTVTATPSRGLVDDQAVQLDGDGYVWGGAPRVRQCAVGATPAESPCDPDIDLGLAVADDGSFATTLHVTALIDTYHEGVIDCRVRACEVVVGDDLAVIPERTARIPLVFDPNGALRPRTLTVTPSDDLRDGQRVHVEGSGFRISRYPSTVDVQQCGVTPIFGRVCRKVTDFQPDDDARFEGDVMVQALLDTGMGVVDCRTSDDACTLAAGPTDRETPHAAFTALHFDPEAQIPSPPAITVTPTATYDGGTVKVTGTGWRTGYRPSVQVCAADATDLFGCDFQALNTVEPDLDGRFSTELIVGTPFVDLNHRTVDCRVAPGCAIVASGGFEQVRVSAPLTFGDPPTPPRRYFEPVFAAVDVTHDVVYRETTDSMGNPVQLTMDIYQPAGDSAEKRPAIVWMDGGYFNYSDTTFASGFATDVARRGYVGITLHYRLRPAMSVPTPPGDEFYDAMRDAYDDAVAGVEWLHTHGADYRIDPRAIVAGGYLGGGSTAFNLAYLPGQRGPAHPGVAAAVSISSLGSLGAPDEGEPPVLAFHGLEDPQWSSSLSDIPCTAAREQHLHCDLVTYERDGRSIETHKHRDIIQRSMDFLAKEVLGPLGYVEGEPPTTTPTTSTTAAEGSSSTDAGNGSGGDDGGGGHLPQTGTAVLRLAPIGIVLVTGGALAVLGARRRRQMKG